MTRGLGTKRLQLWNQSIDVRRIDDDSSNIAYVERDGIGLPNQLNDGQFCCVSNGEFVEDV